MFRQFRRKTLTAAILIASSGLLASPCAWSANHREAPLTALDTKADITDWYAFVSYDDPTKVTMILNVDPLLEPANGPNYFPFDNEILYEMKVDNSLDADEDIKIQFRFNKAEIRAPGVFTGFVGAGSGINAPANAPNPVLPNPIVPPAITALDGPGSEGLSLRQTYTVTILKKTGAVWNTVFSSGALKMFAVPSNVGPRTMPNYPALAAQGIYSFSSSGVKVFAGTVDDPFYIDLGATFDSLNFRTAAGGGVLSAAADANDHTNIAPDSVSGFNVNTIAIQLPITLLTKDGALHGPTDSAAVIGAYATTSRPRIKTQPTVPGGNPALSTNFVQIQRMGNPLINELLIGTGDKDKFSMSEPKNDSQFASYLLDPLLTRVLNSIYGIAIPAPPRTDLLPLVTYAPPIAPPGTTAGPVADLLRLNTGVSPTPMPSRKRLGLLAGDGAGFPNGRRVSDDITDISLRAVAGILAGSQFNYTLGDGVNTNDVPYQEVFPYVGFANSGRNSVHIGPGQAGCTGGSGSPCPIN